MLRVDAVYPVTSQVLVKFTDTFEGERRPYGGHIMLSPTGWETLKSILIVGSEGAPLDLQFELCEVKR